MCQYPAQEGKASSLNKCTDLQFGDHTGLGVVAGTVLVHQSFGQHLGIELLEHVFILNILENHHLMRKDVGESCQSHELTYIQQFVHTTIQYAYSAQFAHFDVYLKHIHNKEHCNALYHFQCNERKH